MHLAVFPPLSQASTLSFTFLSSQILCCQNACQPKEQPLPFLFPFTPSLLSVFSLNICHHRSTSSPPLSQRAAESVCTAVVSSSHHFTAYHRGNISELRPYSCVRCFKEHVQGHSLTKFLPCLKLFGFQEQASRRGCRAARTG